MGKIKSAWEIAFERTEHLEIDEERIKHKAEIEAIKRIAGSYLAADEKKDDLLSELKDKDKESVKEALKDTILSSLTLPSYEVKDDRYERLSTLAHIVLSEDGINLFDQIIAFLKQYPLHKKDLIERLEKELEPMLEEKSKQFRKEYGRDIKLSLEDDKEAMEIVNKQLDALDKQYQNTLSGAKAQLEELF